MHFFPSHEDLWQDYIYCFIKTPASQPFSHKKQEKGWQKVVISSLKYFSSLKLLKELRVKKKKGRRCLFNEVPDHADHGFIYNYFWNVNLIFNSLQFYPLLPVVFFLFKTGAFEPSLGGNFKPDPRCLEEAIMGRMSWSCLSWQVGIPRCHEEGFYVITRCMGLHGLFQFQICVSSSFGNRPNLIYVASPLN